MFSTHTSLLHTPFKNTKSHTGMISTPQNPYANTLYQIPDPLTHAPLSTRATFTKHTSLALMLIHTTTSSKTVVTPLYSLSQNIYSRAPSTFCEKLSLFYFLNRRPVSYRFLSTYIHFTFSLGPFFLSSMTYFSSSNYNYRYTSLFTRNTAIF